VPFHLWVQNTLIVVILTTIGTLVTASLVAYSFARFQYRGRDLLFFITLGTMMLPAQVTLIPQFVLFQKLGWVNTLYPLWVPAWFGGSAFSIFLLRQFLLTIPDSIVDAARIDGCSEWQVLLRVVAPMARPGIAATAIFQFFYAWNDYYGPLLYTSEDQANWTLSIALSQFKTLHHVEWNLVMAATLLVMAPVIIVFFFAQKAFVQEVTLTGVKG
jgi:multiple sugar transport system permease protein